MSTPDTSGSSPVSDGQGPRATRKTKAPKGAIQFDRWGIKANIRPARVGDEESESWKDVGSFFNATLRRIAVDFPGLVSDILHGARKIVRGAAQMPPAKRAKVEKLHAIAERAEGRRQELQENGQRPRPEDSEVVGQFIDLLEEIKSRGVVVEVRELPDGSTAIVIVDPGKVKAAEKIIAAALPDVQSASGSSGIPLANILPRRLATILTNHGLMTAGQLAQLSAEGLQGFEGIGEKSLNQIELALGRIGLSLASGPGSKDIREFSVKLNESLERLDAQSRAVMTLRYGLSKEGPKTLAEIAEILGISRSSVSRIEHRAIRELLGEDQA